MQDKNRQVNFELGKEAQAYGDIQLLPFVDYYSLLTVKTIAICIMGVRTFKYSWVKIEFNYQFQIRVFFYL